MGNETKNLEELAQPVVPVAAPDYIRRDCGCCGFESLNYFQDNSACPRCNHTPLGKTELFIVPPTPLVLDNNRDTLRYRFLRDTDAWGCDNDPRFVSWDDLADLEGNEFDAAIDARIANSDINCTSLLATNDQKQCKFCENIDSYALESLGSLREIIGELCSIAEIHEDIVKNVSDEVYRQCPTEVQDIIRKLAVFEIPTYKEFEENIAIKTLEKFIESEYCSAESHVCVMDYIKSVQK